jgi:hypothetical protein
MALKRLFSLAGQIFVGHAKAPRQNQEQARVSVVLVGEQDSKQSDKVLS